MSGRRALAGRARIARALAIAVGLAAAIGGCGKSTLDPLRETRPDPLRRTPPPAVTPAVASPSVGSGAGPLRGDRRLRHRLGGRGAGGAHGVGLESRLRHHDRRQQLSRRRPSTPSTPTSASTTGASSATTAARTARAARRTASGRRRATTTGTTARWRPYLDYFTLPGNERYYDVAIGPVHLFAVDSDPREPDGNTEGSVQARWLRDGAVGVVVVLRRRLLPPPRLLLGFHGSYSACGGRSRAGAPTSSSPATTTSTSASKVGGIRHITVGLSGNEPTRSTRRSRSRRCASRHGAARCSRPRAKTGSRFSSSRMTAPRSTRMRRSSPAAGDVGRSRHRRPGRRLQTRRDL